MKKHLKGIIIGVIAVLLLAGGTVFMVNYEPKNDIEENTVETTGDITVLELETAERITVSGTGTEIGFIKDGDDWTVVGVDADETDGLKIKKFVSAALVYKTDKIIEDADKAKYGLDKPQYTVSIINGTDTNTVIIGDKSAVDDVYFASVDDKVFTMSKSQYDTITNELEYYTDYNRVSIKSDDIVGVKIQRENETIDIYLPELTRLEGNVWRMREPYDMMANDTFMDTKVLNQIGSITLSEKASDLGTQRAVLTVTTNDDEYVFKIGETNGDKVYVEYDGKVYAESSSLFEFVDAEVFNFVSKLTSYVNILDISSLEMEYDGITHNIEVIGKDASEFKADGVPADSNLTKQIYQSVIGIMSDTFYNNEPLGEKLLTITFKGKDDFEDVVVEYYAINEYKAAISLNGKTGFVTAISEVEQLKSNINEYYKLVKGE